MSRSIWNDTSDYVDGGKIFEEGLDFIYKCQVCKHETKIRNMSPGRVPKTYPCCVFCGEAKVCLYNIVRAPENSLLRPGDLYITNLEGDKFWEAFTLYKDSIKINGEPADVLATAAAITLAILHRDKKALESIMQQPVNIRCVAHVEIADSADLKKALSCLSA